MVYITGDTHGEFSRFSNKKFDTNEKDYIIICGDFGGIWDNSKQEEYWLNWLNKKKFIILFIDGNHDNFDMLSKFETTEWNGGKVQFIKSNIIHLMRGQIYNIDGKIFYTMGGASSHDVKDGIFEIGDPKIDDFKHNPFAMYRINHKTWWQEELPSNDEYNESEKNLNLYNRNVDYIITHCAPNVYTDIIGRGEYKHDRLTSYLEQVYLSCTFKKWFFGHYHDNKEFGDKMIMLYDKILNI